LTLASKRDNSDSLSWFYCTSLTSLTSTRLHCSTKKCQSVFSEQTTHIHKR